MEMSMNVLAAISLWFASVSMVNSGWDPEVKVFKYKCADGTQRYHVPCTDGKEHQ